jgi:YHS domain-containing protein
VAILETSPAWNYTSFLDIAFLVLMAVLAWRFFTTGGVDMLRAMSHPPHEATRPVADPVCGMSVDPATANEKMDYAGTTYYFCSAACKQRFAADPEKYVGAAKVGHRGH